MKRMFETLYAKESSKMGLALSYQEGVTPKTKLELWLKYEDGHSEVVLLGENVVTDLGRSNMAHLLAGDDTTNRKVYSVKFGDGGHSPGDPTQPLIPTASDSALYGNEVIEKVVSYSFPDGIAGTKVMFSATIAEGEGNGGGAQAYSEVGLYDLAGRMLTHKCFGLITKSNAFSMTLQYTILF